MHDQSAGEGNDYENGPEGAHNTNVAIYEHEKIVFPSLISRDGELPHMPGYLPRYEDAKSNEKVFPNLAFPEAGDVFCGIVLMQGERSQHHKEDEAA